MSTLFALTFQSAETPQPTFDISIAQNTLIRLALNENANQFARGGAIINADICDWKFISCTDSRATTLCIRSSQLAKKAVVDVEWLPPTLEFIHFEYILMHNEEALTYLPRELKYMYWGSCFGVTRNVDCSRLPHKMEEIILQKSTYAGEINLGLMPHTMRFVFIEQVARYTNEITVNYNSLPVSLKEVWVTSELVCDDMKRRVRAIGKLGAVTLETKYDSRYPKEGSRYLSTFLEYN